MQVIDSCSLQDLTGVKEDTRRISDLGYAAIEHGYDIGLIQKIAENAVKHRPKGHKKFLSLEHLRNAHVHIPEIKQLMHDSGRLERLSHIAGVHLEPYPISRAASHINYYYAERVPIAFHTDGAAMVELIPLAMSGGGGATLIYCDRPEIGELRLQKGHNLEAAKIRRIGHQIGRSVLLQGRMLLHAAEDVGNGSRTTLVLVLRSVSEPYKDDNSLERLLLDDDLEQVQAEWIDDVIHKKKPALQELYRRRSPK